MKDFPRNGTTAIIKKIVKSSGGIAIKNKGSTNITEHPISIITWLKPSNTVTIAFKIFIKKLNIEFNTLARPWINFPNIFFTFFLQSILIIPKLFLSVY